jgi:hypothetical protein
MPAPTRTPLARPPGAPAYYLARPATWWLTTVHPPGQPRTRPAPARATPARRSVG